MAVVSWWSIALEALSGNPFFREAARKTAGSGLLACDDLFATCVRAVCGQQVNTAVAEKTARAVFDFAGVNAVRTLAQCDVLQLKSLGLTQTKAQAIAAFARGFDEGSLSRSVLEPLEDEAVRARLTQMHGVGPWTADMVLIFGLNRPDVWAIRDFGLRKALKLSGLENENSEQWAPWRTAATWLLWQSLTAAPVQY